MNILEKIIGVRNLHSHENENGKIKKQIKYDRTY